MRTRITINGREVTNPAVKAAITSIMLSMVALILALLAFVVLPMIGIAVGIGAGIAGVIGGTLALGGPLLRRRALRVRREQLLDDAPLDERMRIDPLELKRLKE